MDRREVLEVGKQLSEEERLQHLSRWMKARLKSKNEDKINFCPYGCEIEDLDDHSYCKHVVGFTTDGKGFEPYVTDEDPRSLTYGRRLIRVKTRREGGKVIPELEPVLKSDHLERITSTSVVYRKKAPDLPSLPDKAEARRALAEKRDAPAVKESKPGRTKKQIPETELAPAN